MVGPVRVDGLSSGIDYTSIIEKLMAIQKAPIVRFQGRVAEITETQTSLLQVNANLLALKGVMTSLSRPSLYNQSKVTSSNESVLRASGTSISAMGAYTFSVSQLAQSHQLMSNGYIDSDVTQLNSSDETLRVEIGGGNLDRRTHVSFLNGQNGIDRGAIQITDDTGTTSVIDMSHVMDVQDVLDAINSNTSLTVNASVSGNKIVVENVSSISNFGVDSTATSLGIEGTAVGGAIYGKDINTVTGNTSLDLLNDGLGIHRNGTSVDDFKITDMNGTGFFVDLTASETTVQDVIDKINLAAANASATTAVSASLFGNSIVLSDTVQLGAGLTVSAVSGSYAAADLGFGNFDPNSSNFTQVSRESSTTGLLSSTGNRIYGESLIPTLNTTKRTLLNGGQSDISSDLLKGVRGGEVDFTDRAGNTKTLNLTSRVEHEVTSVTSPTTFIVGLTSPGSDPLAGFAIGNRVRFQTDSGIEERLIVDIDANINEIEVDSALDGDALNKAAYAVTESVDDIMRLVNDRLAAAGVGIKMDLNPVTNGFRITDTSGGNLSNLIVADSTTAFGVNKAAADLGIADTVSEDTIVGGDVDVQFLSRATRLSTLNGGKGVMAGKFQVTDRDGTQFTVDLGQSDDVTLGAVMDDANGVAPNTLTFRINDMGDGLLVSSTTGGTGLLRIQEVDSGRTASDLNIEGTAEAGFPSEIDGSFENVIKISTGSTLEDVAKAINSAHLGVQAMVINDGSPTNPYRISLISTRAGQNGRLVVDSDLEGLSFATSAEAQNSVLLYGSNSSSGDPILISKSDNFISDIVQGMSMELLSTSSSPVTVTVARDLENIEMQAVALTEKYNDVIQKFRELTYFDPATYTTGPLFGDPTVRRIESEMGGMVTLPVEGIPSSQLNTLTSIGFTTTGEGALMLDGSKFASALQTNFDEVISVFTKQKPVKLNTGLSELSNGIGITTSSGDDFTIMARDGITKFSVDLGENDSISSLLLKINADAENTGSTITASISSDGYSIQLDDSSTIDSRLASAGSTTVFKIQETDLSDLTDSRIEGSTITFGATSANPGEVRTIEKYDPLTYEITLDSPLNAAITQNDQYTLERELEVQAIGNNPAAAQLKILQKLELGKNSLAGGLLNLDGDPGVASRMVEKLDYFTRIGDGLISTRTDSLDDTIDSVNQTIERIEKRVENEETRLVREFARLEIILAESQQTMSNIQSSLLAFVSSMKTK